MSIIKTALAIAMSILLAASVVAPASAALWYNPDTNQFEERSASATNRGGSPIKKQIVDYETTQKPGTIIIETGERRLYLVLEGGKAIRRIVPVSFATISS